MKRRFALVGLLFAGTLLCSWGFLVHRTTVQLAIYQLPKGIQPFFYQNKAALVKASVRPDQRRNVDSSEAPKHFIDLEMYGDSAAWRMPHPWLGAVAKYSEDTLKKYGYVPYWIETIQQKLTAAFRAGNADSALFYAADLAHYIGDAHVPLHTSVNYDGQLTAQKGLHALWESTIPELELNNYTLSSRHRARYVANKEARIWSAVQSAYQLLPQLFLQERTASAGFTDSTKFRVQVRNGKESKTYTAAFARAYSQKLGNTINGQLVRSADMIADFWYTAWVDAGRPDVKNFFKTPYTKEDKTALKKEVKSYRHNHLLKDSLLLARNGSAKTDD
ncbi:MAG TPA: zinc dependent phospholipase C family protein [Chitinophagaceae bacterium]|nr:zinc dependent phospholipase C family protein [Chitinophagaceae bacterium]